MNNFLNFSLKNTYVIIEKSTFLHNAITCSVLVENFLIPFLSSQYFFEIIKWCKNKQLKFMLQDLLRIREAQFGGGWSMIFWRYKLRKVWFFLNYLIWVLTNTFRFSCVLQYSCWKTSHFSILNDFAGPFGVAFF